MADSREPRYTPAQLAAMEWLPSDGSWRSNPYRQLIAGATLTELCSIGLAEWKSNYPVRPASYRLTPRGVAEKARLAGDENRGSR
jgi:hypothetical protein